MPSAPPISIGRPSRTPIRNDPAGNGAAMSGGKAMAGWRGADPEACVRLVETCAEAIRRHDGRLRAFITPTIDSALDAARAADEVAGRGHLLGLLHGAVVALKDNIEV